MPKKDYETALYLANQHGLRGRRVTIEYTPADTEKQHGPDFKVIPTNERGEQI
jgi:hypothetical protein